MKYIFIFLWVVVTQATLFAQDNRFLVEGSGSGSEATILPVRLTKLSLVRQSTNAIVGWTNLTEEDVVYYNVERSSNGRQFLQVGTVRPKHNNGNEANYSFTDFGAAHKTVYYRLAILERNSKVSYSRTLKLIHQPSGGFTLAPNPIVGKILQYNALLPPGSYQLHIFDTNGKLFCTQMLEHRGGQVAGGVELEQLAKGDYILKLSGPAPFAQKFQIR